MGISQRQSLIRSKVKHQLWKVRPRWSETKEFFSSINIFLDILKYFEGSGIFFLKIRSSSNIFLKSFSRSKIVSKFFYFLSSLIIFSKKFFFDFFGDLLKFFSSVKTFVNDFKMFFGLKSFFMTPSLI